MIERTCRQCGRKFKPVSKLQFYCKRIECIRKHNNRVMRKLYWEKPEKFRLRSRKYPHPEQVRKVCVACGQEFQPTRCQVNWQKYCKNPECQKEKQRVIAKKYRLNHPEKFLAPPVQPRKCAACDNIFTPDRYHPEAKYCSNKCRGREQSRKWRSDPVVWERCKARARKHPIGERIPKQCPHCKKTFTLIAKPEFYHIGKTKYCSPECRIKANDLRYHERHTQFRTCKHCKKQFRATKELWAYCSLNCKNLQYEKLHPTIKRCKYCNAEIIREKGKRRDFCNRDHFDKWFYNKESTKLGRVRRGTLRNCKTCGKAFAIRAVNQVYCSEACMQPVIKTCIKCGLQKVYYGKGLCLSCGKKARLLRIHPFRKKLCVQCKKIEFETRNPQRDKYCSDECRFKAYKKSPTYLKRINSKEFRKAQRARYDKWKSDPVNALHVAMSNAISRSLKGHKDGRAWEKTVGYTRHDLAKHLEAQFYGGMSWKNRGFYGWHIHHINPKSNFKFKSYEDPKFKACWALENLAPRWWWENLAQGNRYIG